MDIIGIIEKATPLYVLGILALFGICVVALAIAMFTRKFKVAIYPIATLFSLVIPALFVRGILSSQFLAAVNDSNVSIAVTPAITISARSALSESLSKIYYSKGQSGSHPTENRYTFKVCMKDSPLCQTVIIAQDSREPKLHWVSFEANIASIPMGFVRFSPWVQKES